MASGSASLSTLVRTQQEDLRVLREFVDALRAVKRPERVDTEVRNAIRASSDANNANQANANNTNANNANNTNANYANNANADIANANDDDADADLTQFTRTMQSLFARLKETMKRIDEGEATQPPPPKPASGRAPPAPAGLLSLRDYAVLQAAVEVFFCWSVFPCVEEGLVLPLDRRRPTKTLEISSHVLTWGSKVSATRVVELEAIGRHLSTATRAMLQLLLVPSLQPILLPKYTVEVIALLVYEETNGSGDVTGMLASLLRVLPLRLSMASLRATLGQSSGRSATIVAFKKRCGQRLAQLLMEDGGVQTTIEMLLGGVDEGNTQARLQVATLICQCPAHVKPEVYAASLARQVRTLFDGSNRQNKLLRETAAVLVSEMATRFASVLDTEFLVPMLKPLLVYETQDDTEDPATETEIAECVALLHVLLCGPPPAMALVVALVPVFRPLVHLFGFAVASKSLLGPPLEETLIAFIKAIPNAATLLQISALPVVPPLRPALAVCGSRRVPSDDTREVTIEWAPWYAFCPGGSGGIAMRMRPRQLIAGDAETDSSMPLRLAVVGMVQLLAAKELENSVVVGELFSSLLLTYIRVRKSLADSDETAQVRPTAAAENVIAEYESLKAPRDALGLELTLSLLLAIIESLGPSVLRSAETVLQCLTTVLGMFARDKTSFVDAQEETAAEDDQEEEDDDVLTVCLGVLMTILEAGATQRSESEERGLREMLPVLEALSRYPRPQISELATNARASILSRGAIGEPPKPRVEESFEQTLRNAAEDMQSALVPLRARGVVTLTKLVRRSEAHRNDAEWTPRITQLMTIFIAHLADAESYVYLAAVQGLAALADANPDVAIPLLTANLRDKSHSLEMRIKLSEALLFTAKRCGETLPKYAKVFVYAYLECIRPPPRPSTQQKKPFSLIQEIDQEETNLKTEPTDEEREVHVQAANAALVEATLRASCLSNLAEVSAMLQWSLAPFASDILSCVFGILQLELDMSAHSVVAVRRGAVFLLKYVLQLLGYKIIEVLPDQLKPMYHALKHVALVDKDEVVRFHAQHALHTLDEIMRGELFPSAQEDEALGGLRALRIVKH